LSKRDESIEWAHRFLGFSYYWGGAAWKEGGEKGSCSGGCPNCTHRGLYGADCSGLIGKVWQHPNALPMEKNKHPYSTLDYFKPDGKYWYAIEREEAVPGDALVRRSSGSGHIVLIVEPPDDWLQPNVIEAKGCRMGIVQNIRKFGNNYQARRLKEDVE
jgi:cell wall-associated NlpC family hydrolase